MTPYEILLMLDPELPDERQNEIVTRTRELVERGGGTFERHDVWGRRRLAYEIDHKAEGSYHLLTLQADAGTLDESWKQEPGTPVYGTDFDAAGVKRALAEAKQERTPAFSAS